MPSITPSSFPFNTVAATQSTGATEEALTDAAAAFELYNDGPNTVYWSTDTGVTTATGFPLVNGEKSPVYPKDPQMPLSLYFVCAAAETASVRVLEQF